MYIICATLMENGPLGPNFCKKFEILTFLKKSPYGHFGGPCKVKDDGNVLWHYFLSDMGAL